MESSILPSREGYLWTAQAGLQRGLKSLGVLSPSSDLSDPSQQTSNEYDVIVIGAGYAGLTAARDLVNTGRRVLLIEGRDRIGGRTWSACVDGHYYDLGGSWISPDHAHVWTELSRYNMMSEVEIVSGDRAIEPSFTLKAEQNTLHFSRDESEKLMASALKKFFDVDSVAGKDEMPFPFDDRQFGYAKKHPHQSLADRLEQAKQSLSPEELTALSGMLCLCSGTPLEKGSFAELLHWWALCGYSFEGFEKNLRTYSLRCGQSSLARRIFDEAYETTLLSYILKCPVSSVKTDGPSVLVTTGSGGVFRARKVICAVSANVLPTMAINESIATKARNVNRGAKVFFECSNEKLKNWNGISFPQDHLNFFAANGVNQNGNPIIEAFGHAYRREDSYCDPSKYRGSLEDMVQANVTRMIYHDWNQDEFSRGAWFHPDPEADLTYLAPPKAIGGNIFFASSDWASGWRGFIDGAIEQGRRVALIVAQGLQGEA